MHSADHALAYRLQIRRVFGHAYRRLQWHRLPRRIEIITHVFDQMRWPQPTTGQAAGSLRQLQGGDFPKALADA